MTDYNELIAAAVERRDRELEKVHREYRCAMMASRNRACAGECKSIEARFLGR